jgi:hypothetical protein
VENSWTVKRVSWTGLCWRPERGDSGGAGLLRRWKGVDGFAGVRGHLESSGNKGVEWDRSQKASNTPVVISCSPCLCARSYFFGSTGVWTFAKQVLSIFKIGSCQLFAHADLEVWPSWSASQGFTGVSHRLPVLCLLLKTCPSPFLQNRTHWCHHDDSGAGMQKFFNKIVSFLFYLQLWKTNLSVDWK